MKQATKRLICAALCFAMLAGFFPLAAAETGYDRGFDGGMAGTGNLYMVYHDLYSTRYGMYQYSFDTYVNGQGPFDCNVCYKEYPGIVRKYGFNGYAEQESWIEKATFDPWVYKNRYDDLKGKTDEQLKEHWLAFGIKEGQPVRFWI